jgi:hypothetical protein
MLTKAHIKRFIDNSTKKEESIDDLVKKLNVFIQTEKSPKRCNTILNYLTKINDSITTSSVFSEYVKKYIPSLENTDRFENCVKKKLIIQKLKQIHEKIDKIIGHTNISTGQAVPVSNFDFMNTNIIEPKKKLIHRTFQTLSIRAKQSKDINMFIQAKKIEFKIAYPSEKTLKLFEKYETPISHRFFILVGEFHELHDRDVSCARNKIINYVKCHINNNSSSPFLSSDELKRVFDSPPQSPSGKRPAGPPPSQPSGNTDYKIQVYAESKYCWPNVQMKPEEYNKVRFVQWRLPCNKNTNVCPSCQNAEEIVTGECTEFLIKLIKREIELFSPGIFNTVPLTHDYNTLFQMHKDFDNYTKNNPQHVINVNTWFWNNLNHNFPCNLFLGLNSKQIELYKICMRKSIFSVVLFWALYIYNKQYCCLVKCISEFIELILIRNFLFVDMDDFTLYWAGMTHVYILSEILSDLGFDMFYINTTLTEKNTRRNTMMPQETNRIQSIPIPHTDNNIPQELKLQNYFYKQDRNKYKYKSNFETDVSDDEQIVKHDQARMIMNKGKKAIMF